MAEAQHDPSLDTEEEFEVDLSALANGRLPAEWLEALQQTGQLPENLLAGSAANTDPTPADKHSLQQPSGTKEIVAVPSTSHGSPSHPPPGAGSAGGANGAAQASGDARASLQEVRRRASATPTTYLPSPREREKMEQARGMQRPQASANSPSQSSRRDSIDSRPSLYDEQMSTNGSSQQGDPSKGFNSNVPPVDKGWYSHIESWQKRKQEKLQDLRAEKARQESHEEQHGFKPKLAPGTRRRQVQGRAVDRMYKWQQERDARLAEKKRKAQDLAADPELTFQPDTRKTKNTLKYGPGKAPPPSTAGIDGTAPAVAVAAGMEDSASGSGPLAGRKLAPEEVHAIRARQQSDVEAFAQRMQKAREAAKEKGKHPKPGAKYTGKVTVPVEFKLSSGRRKRAEGGKGGASRAKGGVKARIGAQKPHTAGGGYARGPPKAPLPEPGAAGSGIAYLKDAQARGVAPAAPTAEPPVGAAYAKYAADVAQLLSASPASESGATATGSEGVASNDGLPTPEHAPNRNIRFSSPPQTSPEPHRAAAQHAGRPAVAFAGDTAGQGSSLGSFPATPPPGGHVAWGVTFNEGGQGDTSPGRKPPPPPPHGGPSAAQGLQPLDISSPNGATPRGGAGGFAPAARHVPTPAHNLPSDAQAARARAVDATAAALAPPSPSDNAPPPPQGQGMTVQFVSGSADVHTYPAHTQATTPGAATRANAGATPRFAPAERARTFAAGATPHAAAVAAARGGGLDFEEPPDSAGQSSRGYAAPPQGQTAYSPTAGHTPHPSRGGANVGFAADQGATAGHTPHPSRGGANVGFAADQGATAGHTPHPSRGGANVGFAADQGATAGHTPHPSRGGANVGFAADQGATAGHTPHPSRGGAHVGFANARALSPTHNLETAFADASNSPRARGTSSGVSPHVSFASGSPQVSGGGHVSWAGAVQSPPARTHVPPTPHPASGLTRGAAQGAGAPTASAPSSPASNSLDQLSAQLASVRAELDAERQRAAQIRSMADSYSGGVPPTPAPPPPLPAGEGGTPMARGPPMPSAAPGHFYSSR